MRPPVVGCIAERDLAAMAVHQVPHLPGQRGQDRRFQHEVVGLGGEQPGVPVSVIALRPVMPPVQDQAEQRIGGEITA
jgi:hypothetical protein